jgi:hypothetical protein
MTKRQGGWDRRLQEPNKRWIAIFKEKHGTHQYVILNEAEVDRVCLFVLKIRLRDKWYYEPKAPELKATAYTRAEAEALKSPAKEVSLQEIKQNERKQNAYQESKELWDRIQKAIQDNDGKEAFNILMERSDHEYESFELVSGYIPEEA